LGYPSGHPDPHSSIIASAVESQSTTGSAATGISTATTGSSDDHTKLLARQPPIGIETAAATNPTHVPIHVDICHAIADLCGKECGAYRHVCVCVG